jgi:hypothetical protein
MGTMTQDRSVALALLHRRRGSGARDLDRARGRVEVLITQAGEKLKPSARASFLRL